VVELCRRYIRDLPYVPRFADETWKALAEGNGTRDWVLVAVNAERVSCPNSLHIRELTGNFTELEMNL